MITDTIIRTIADMHIIIKTIIKTAEYCRGRASATDARYSRMPMPHCNTPEQKGYGFMRPPDLPEKLTGTRTTNTRKPRTTKGQRSDQNVVFRVLTSQL